MDKINVNFSNCFTEEVTVDIAMTIHDLKKHLENIFFFSKDLMILKENNRILDNYLILENLNLNSNSQIQVDIKILGGTCRYKKSHSMLRWKSKLKRTRRLQRKRRKMRNRAK